MKARRWRLGEYKEAGGIERGWYKERGWYIWGEGMRTDREGIGEYFIEIPQFNVP